MYSFTSPVATTLPVRGAILGSLGLSWSAETLRGRGGVVEKPVETFRNQCAIEKQEFLHRRVQMRTGRS
jgi:hypothetical protein